MSAKDAAAKVQPGSNVRWDRLERAAFAAHPAVLGEGRSPSRKLGRLSPWRKVLLVLVALVCFALYFSPVWGIATIAEGRYTPIDTDPHQTIPAASVLFMCAALVVVASFVHWLTSGRRRSPLYLLQAVMATVLGGLTAASMAKQGIDEPVDNWQLWMIPVVAAIVLGAIFALVVLVASAGRTSARGVTDSEVPANKVETLTRRREQVAQLSDDERAAITRDIESAISDLERRGLISALEAERARGAELGALALRMPRATKPR